MAGEVGVGAIGAGGFLRWGPSGDMAGGKKTRPIESFSLSGSHLITEPRLIKARAPVMPFVNAGISRFC